MKITTECSVSSLSSLARLGVAGVVLGAAALTGWAQTSGSSSAQSTNTRAQERASDRTSMSRSDATNAGMSRQDQKFIEKFGETSQREIALSQLAAERASNPQVKAFAQKMVSDHSKAHSEFMAVASGGALTTDSSSLSAATSERASASGTSTTSGSGAKAQRDTTSGNQTSGSTAAGVTTRGTDSTGHTAAGTSERSTASATDRSRSTASTSHSGMAMNTDFAKNDRVYKKLMDKNGAEFDKAYMKAMIDEHEDAVDMLEDLVKDDDRHAQLRAFANKTLPNLRAHLSEAKQIEKQLD